MTSLTEAMMRVSSRAKSDEDFSVSVIWPKSLAKVGVTSSFQLVMKFLALRKSVFVDEKKWGLFHSEGVEFEQYDVFGPKGMIGAVYIIAHRNDEVIGGARLVRTDNEIGGPNSLVSYMIRDACLGYLEGMPTNLCDDEPPVSPRIWELTRLVTTGEIRIGEAILSTANEFLYEIHADQCLFLGPPAFMRMAKIMGFKPMPLGKIQGNRDGRFLAFSCPVIKPDQVQGHLAASRKCVAE